MYGLIKFCKKIKESTSYAKCRSPFVVTQDGKKRLQTCAISAPNRS